ncbi:hypothetical protein B0A55_07605 [Friedmanniomyces simplex]|uniref:Uncharacterized protein n=1 Tax=Friedmanniomyces simplex TaxID=329884 RepID=A0A4U0XKK5_9PEZI|nr:hypothetical protein B0A55_07605 [Friedmanniomyces simplex]
MALITAADDVTFAFCGSLLSFVALLVFSWIIAPQLEGHLFPANQRVVEDVPTPVAAGVVAVAGAETPARPALTLVEPWTMFSFSPNSPRSQYGDSPARSPGARGPETLTTVAPVTLVSVAPSAPETPQDDDRARLLEALNRELALLRSVHSFELTNVHQKLAASEKMREGLAARLSEQRARVPPTTVYCNTATQTGHTDTIHTAAEVAEAEARAETARQEAAIAQQQVRDLQVPKAQMSSSATQTDGAPNGFIFSAALVAEAEAKFAAMEERADAATAQLTEAIAHQQAREVQVSKVQMSSSATQMDGAPDDILISAAQVAEIEAKFATAQQQADAAKAQPTEGTAQQQQAKEPQVPTKPQMSSTATQTDGAPDVLHLSAAQVAEIETNFATVQQQAITAEARVAELQAALDRATKARGATTNPPPPTPTPEAGQSRTKSGVKKCERGHEYLAQFDQCPLCGTPLEGDEFDDDLDESAPAKKAPATKTPAKRASATRTAAKKTPEMKSSAMQTTETQSTATQTAATQPPVTRIPVTRTPAPVMVEDKSTQTETISPVIPKRKGKQTDADDEAARARQEEQDQLRRVAAENARLVAEISQVKTLHDRAAIERERLRGLGLHVEGERDGALSAIERIKQTGEEVWAELVSKRQELQALRAWAVDAEKTLGAPVAGAVQQQQLEGTGSSSMPPASHHQAEETIPAAREAAPAPVGIPPPHTALQHSRFGPEMPLAWPTTPKTLPLAGPTTPPSIRRAAEQMEVDMNRIVADDPNAPPDDYEVPAVLERQALAVAPSSSTPSTAEQLALPGTPGEAGEGGMETCPLCRKPFQKGKKCMDFKCQMQRYRERRPSQKAEPAGPAAAGAGDGEGCKGVRSVRGS